jgi:hypothetical protein
VQLGAAFKLFNVENVYLNNLSTLKPLADKPLIEASDVKGMFVTGCFPLTGNRSFLSLKGAKSDLIVLSGNYLNRIAHPIEKQDGLNPTINLIEK